MFIVENQKGQTRLISIERTPNVSSVRASNPDCWNEQDRVADQSSLTLLIQSIGAVPSECVAIISQRLNPWESSMNRHRIAVAFVLSCAALAVSPGAAAADPPKASSAATAKSKLIIQVSDADPKKWGLALNNAKNVQTDLGKDHVEIEIVAYGPGIGMLKMDSEVGPRVAEAIKDGVAMVACENTMTNQKIAKDDMLPKISYVKAGVVEIMQKQQQGYAYLRPRAAKLSATAAAS
jgi:intracellular sulfur oxidation DsrE/DsrF family protein